MVFLLKTKNMKNFEECIVEVTGKKLIPISISVYSCWKLFNIMYSDVPTWKKTPHLHLEWISELNGLESTLLNNEISGELPSGFAAGVHMTMLFYRAIIMNECSHSINIMADYMEKLKKIGFQSITDESVSEIGLVRDIYMNAPSISFTHSPRRNFYQIHCGLVG